MDIDTMWNLQEALSLGLSDAQKINITRENVFDALFLTFENQSNLEWGGDVWDLDLNYDNAFAILKEFDFATLKNQVETVDIIPKEFLLIETKVRIKHSNLIWVIHKADADPFPSQPHAHQLDQNIKMDLSNGKLYRKTQYLHQIPHKEFIEIRKKFSAVYKGKLPQLAI